MAPAPESVHLAFVYALLLGSAVLGGVGDILIFKWAKAGGWWFVGGTAVWVVSLALMGVLFRLSSLSFSLTVILLIVVHLLVDVAWDVGVTGSRLSRWEWAGAVLAVLAVVLLHVGKREEPTGMTSPARSEWKP